MSFTKLNEACKTCSMQLRCMWIPNNFLYGPGHMLVSCTCGYQSCVYPPRVDCDVQVRYYLCPLCQSRVPILGKGSIQERLEFFAEKRRPDEVQELSGLPDGSKILGD